MGYEGRKVFKGDVLRLGVGICFVGGWCYRLLEEGFEFEVGGYWLERVVFILVYVLGYVVV